jgi:hypothetical protein
VPFKYCILPCFFLAGSIRIILDCCHNGLFLTATEQRREPYRRIPVCPLLHLSINAPKNVVALVQAAKPVHLNLERHQKTSDTERINNRGGNTVEMFLVFACCWLFTPRKKKKNPTSLVYTMHARATPSFTG